MMPSDHGSRVATQLEELRDAVGEIDALAALALDEQTIESMARRSHR